MMNAILIRGKTTDKKTSTDGSKKSNFSSRYSLDVGLLFRIYVKDYPAITRNTSRRNTS